MFVIVGMNLKYYAGLKTWQKPGECIYYIISDDGKFIFFFGFPPLTSCCKYSWLWTIFSVGLEDWKQSIIAYVNPQWQYNKRIKVWLFSNR
jgi:hypothetical protein